MQMLSHGPSPEQVKLDRTNAAFTVLHNMRFTLKTKHSILVKQIDRRTRSSISLGELVDAALHVEREIDALEIALDLIRATVGIG